MLLFMLDKIKRTIVVTRFCDCCMAKSRLKFDVVIFINAASSPSRSHSPSISASISSPGAFRFVREVELSPPSSLLCLLIMSSLKLIS